MMKNIAIAFVCAGALMAQDGLEKTSVPLTDPTRPVRLQASLMMGGITVHGANVKEVIVEARARSGEDRRESRPSRAAGMKRIDIPGSTGLDVTEENNSVTIRTSAMHSPSDLIITVPRHTSLQLKCMNDGDIRVDQVEGEIDADDLNGKITLNNVSGSVLAHSLNGAVVATLDQIDPSKPMSFSTMNGDIDVTLPESLKANVRMKTDNGEIYSDFDVKLNAGSRAPQNEPGRGQNGLFHVRFDRTLHGSINGGGPDFQFTSFNGQIYIRKKK
jgi:hypothetical protein